MGLDLATTTGGPLRGVPMVVLHGFTGSGAAMAPLVDELRQTRQVVTVDLVGHGASPSPTDVDAYAMAQVVTDFWQAVEAPVVDLFGYSMGGRVALSAAVAHPERVRRLALLGASAGLASEHDRIARRASDEALAESIERNGLPAFIDRWLDLAIFDSLKGLGPQWLAESKAQRCASDPVGIANSLRGTGTGSMPPLHEALSTLATPTLWLAGSNDHKYATIGADLAASMPDARFAAVAEAGHAAHSEQPAAVARALVGFFAR